jgi:HD-GYP domain-containing protein (c-di-GMP phosphodiesterase class II)
MTFINDSNASSAFSSTYDYSEMLIDKNEIREHLSKLQNIIVSIVNTLTIITELRDPYTSGHEVRVAKLAGEIAKKLNLSAEEKFIIDISSRVHDIGKFWIPSEILARPAPLLPVQYEVVKLHSKIGYEVLKTVNFPWPIEKIVLHHHERLDGSGYPNGIKGDQILFEAKIIAVADVVESMSSHRPYRPSLGLEYTIKTIQEGKGTLFDPEIVDICIDLLVKENFSFPEYKTSTLF